MSTLQRGREVYRPGLCPTPQLLTDPDASFKLPPCPTRQSEPHPQQPSDDGTSASQHRYLQSKPYLTQNPHPESRGKEQSCWGERRWGGPSNWHRLPAKHISESHHQPAQGTHPPLPPSPAGSQHRLLQLPPSSPGSALACSPARPVCHHSPGRRYHVVSKPASMHLTLHLAPVTTLRHTSSDQIPKGELLPRFLWKLRGGKQLAQGSTANS